MLYYHSLQSFFYFPVSSKNAKIKTCKNFDFTCCFLRSLSPAEEHRFRVWRATEINKVQTRGIKHRSCRESRNEELHNLDSLSHIIKGINQGGWCGRSLQGASREGRRLQKFGCKTFREVTFRNSQANSARCDSRFIKTHYIFRPSSGGSLKVLQTNIYFSI